MIGAFRLKRIASFNLQFYGFKRIENQFVCEQQQQQQQHKFRQNFQFKKFTKNMETTIAIAISIAIANDDGNSNRRWMRMPVILKKIYRLTPNQFRRKSHWIYFYRFLYRCVFFFFFLPNWQRIEQTKCEMERKKHNQIARLNFPLCTLNTTLALQVQKKKKKNWICANRLNRWIRIPVSCNLIENNSRSEMHSAMKQKFSFYIVISFVMLLWISFSIGVTMIMKLNWRIVT